jgi:hypothetical protein
VYDFGLTDEQFLELTPAKFNALSRRADAEAERADQHTARVCWAAMTAAGAKKKDGSPITVQDLMVTYEEDEPEPTEASNKIKNTMVSLFGLPAHMQWTRHGG